MTLANTFNAKVAVAITATDTNLQLQSGFADVAAEITDGAHVYLRITEAAGTANEVVIATDVDVATNSLVILRGGNGTTARAWAVSDCVTLVSVVNQAKSSEACCNSCASGTTCECEGVCGELVAACQVVFDPANTANLAATNAQDAIEELYNEHLQITNLDTGDFTVAGDGTVTVNFPTTTTTETNITANSLGTGSLVLNNQTAGDDLFFNTIDVEPPLTISLPNSTVTIGVDLVQLAVALVNDPDALEVLEDALGVNPIVVAPDITGSNQMPEIRPNEFYSYTLTNTGGTVTGGTVTGAPSGLVFDPATLTLSGTTTDPVATNVNIQFDVNNSAGTSQYIDTVNIANRTIAWNIATTTHSSTSTDPAAMIEVIVDQLGLLRVFGDAITTGNWSVPPDNGVGDNYEVLLTTLTGSSPTPGEDAAGPQSSSAEGVWLLLSQQRTWYLTPAVGNTLTAQWQLDIRQAGNPAIIDTIVLDLTSTLN